MQAYFQDIINLDIYIEKGGKEKPKHTPKKIEMNSKAMKDTSSHEAVQLNVCTDYYVGQHRIEYTKIIIIIIIFINTRGITT